MLTNQEIFTIPSCFAQARPQSLYQTQTGEKTDSILYKL